MPPKCKSSAMMAAARLTEKNARRRRSPNSVSEARLCPCSKGSLASAGLFAQVAVIDITDRDRPSCQRTTKAAGELQGRAPVQRGVDRIEIGGAGVAGDAGRGIGHAWRGDDLAGTLEAEPNRHLHAL